MSMRNKALAGIVALAANFGAADDAQANNGHGSKPKPKPQQSAPPTNVEQGQGQHQGQGQEQSTQVENGSSSRSGVNHSGNSTVDNSGSGNSTIENVAGGRGGKGGNATTGPNTATNGGNAVSIGGDRFLSVAHPGNSAPNPVANSNGCIVTTADTFGIHGGFGLISGGVTWGDANEPIHLLDCEGIAAAKAQIIVGKKYDDQIMVTNGMNTLAEIIPAALKAQKTTVKQAKKYRSNAIKTCVAALKEDEDIAKCTSMEMTMPNSGMALIIGFDFKKAAVPVAVAPSVNITNVIEATAVAEVKAKPVTKKPKRRVRKARSVRKVFKAQGTSCKPDEVVVCVPKAMIVELAAATTLENQRLQSITAEHRAKLPVPTK